MNKKEIYAGFEIEYENGKINAPLFGFINPLLVNGNSKLGKGVFTWSTLPGLSEYTVNGIAVKGTCCCDCAGCYAQTGFYKMPSVERANAIKTALARLYTEWMKHAIVAQIKAENIRLVRIHAAGDFFSAEYISAWREIVKACPNTVFWTYTKNRDAENAFDDLSNINIVKSIIPGKGYNFGTCAYIIALYNELKAAGKPVYICRCGIDKNQHCTNCHACIENEHVLFIEHSTEYKAQDDPLYPEIVKLINSQNNAEIAA